MSRAEAVEPMGAARTDDPIPVGIVSSLLHIISQLERTSDEECIYREDACEKENSDHD